MCQVLISTHVAGQRLCEQVSARMSCGFYLSLSLPTSVCVCVLGLGDDSPANRDHLSPVCLLSVSPICSKPRSQTTQGLTHRDSGWRRVAAGQEDEYSTIPSPAASILAASSASHPHITEQTYTWIVTQALTRLGAFTVPCNRWNRMFVLCQWTHEHMLCWTDVCWMCMYADLHKSCFNVVFCF